jgi:branched-chain amino acid transport system substrate-binding protein
MARLVWSLMLGLTVAVAAVGCKARAEVPIGVTVPLSGSLASYGNNVLAGARLAVERVNKAGGIGGRPIALVVEDNRGSNTDTLSSIRKLSGIDRVAAIIGPVTSTNALAAKLEASRLQVSVLTPTATNDQVTANCPFMFRACFVDSFQGRIVANYAYATLGIRKAAILTDKSSDYSKGLSASFKKAFEAAGGQVAAEEGYQQKDTDFGAQLARIKNSGAELIFVPGYPPEVPQIIKQAKVVGFPGRLCGADGWDSEAVLQNAGENLEGCFLVGAFSPEDQRPIVQEFVRQMKAATGRTPGSFEALGYDSVLLLAEAMKGGTTRQAIADGLRAIRGLETVSGKITITPGGDAEKDAVILKIVRDGEAFRTQYVASVSP